MEGKTEQEQTNRYTEIKQNLVIMEKSLASKENKQFLKLCQQIKKQEHGLQADQLAKLLDDFMPREKYGGVLPNGSQDKHELTKQQLQKIIESKELSVYLQVLLLIHLVRRKEYGSALAVAEKIMKELALLNLRHLDSLGATTYFYYSRVQEQTGKQKESRGVLMEAYRHSCVHKDEISQATLLNLLLRNYLSFNQVELAQHFINKTNFPASQQNTQFLRYLYYTALIKSIQQDYADSYQRLTQVLRKAPERGALGFKTKVQKLAIIVEMLMGDVPSKQIFTQSDCKQRLYPYYKLTQAVYKGRVTTFEQVVQDYAHVFRKDKHMNLINRLVINVIKLGFRKINLSYSRISFKDVATKLGLGPSDDLEFIVAKQIRDKVLCGSIDHEKQEVVVKEQKDVYSTQQPAQQFQKRIQFCLHLYHQSNQALQYPDFQTPCARPETQTEEELAQELVKEMEEEGDEFDEF